MKDRKKMLIGLSLANPMAAAMFATQERMKAYHDLLKQGKRKVEYNIKQIYVEKQSGQLGGVYKGYEEQFNTRIEDIDYILKRNERWAKF